MEKKILAFIIIVILFIGLFFVIAHLSKNNGKDTNSEVMGPQSVITPQDINEGDKDDNNASSGNGLIQCLATAGVVIYGSKTCPACASLADSFGGYEKVSPIFVECSQNWARCDSEMQTNYVPEIQIEGKLYEGKRNPKDIAKEVDCDI